MKKRKIYKLLAINTLAVSTASILAVSCANGNDYIPLGSNNTRDTKTSEQIITDSQKEEIQKQMKEELKKVTLDIRNKSKTEISQITPDYNFLESGFDSAKYAIKIKSIQASKEKSYSIDVVFYLEDKKSKFTSEEKTIAIDNIGSFSEEIPNQVVNRQLERVFIDVPNKSVLKASQITPDIVFLKSGYDTNKYTLNIKSVEPLEDDDTNILVTFYLQDIKTKINSKEKTITIRGLLPTLTEEEKMAKRIKQINDAADKVVIDVPNKNILEVTQVTVNTDFTISGFDTSKYTLKIDNINNSYYFNDSLYVWFYLEDKKTKIKTEIKSFRVEGFKKWLTDERKERLQREINQEVKDVNIDIDNKREIEASRVTRTTDFSESGFNKSDYYLRVKSVEVSKKDNRSISVVFYLERFLLDIKSEERTIEISGFKDPLTEAEKKAIIQNKINKEVEKVKIDVNNKNKIETSKITTDTEFLKSGFDSEIYTLKVKSVKVSNTDNSEIFVTFYLQDTKSKIDSKERTILISDFKPAAENKEEIEKQLNAELEKVNIGIDEPTFGRNYYDFFNGFNFITAGFNKEKYYLNILNISTPNEKEPSVNVEFNLQNKNRNISSKHKTITINGFYLKPEVIQSKLNEEVEKVTLDFKDKSNILINDAIKILLDRSASRNSIIDNTRAKIEIVDAVKSKTQVNGIDVSFIIQMEGYGLITSKIKTLTINGFKPSLTNEQIAAIQKQVDLDAKKVSIDLFDKNQFAFNVDNSSNFILNDYDNEKYDLVIVSTNIPKTDNTKIDVTFYIKDKKHDINSKEITVSISGFLSEDAKAKIQEKLNEEVEKVRFTFNSRIFDKPQSEIAVSDLTESRDNFLKEGYDKEKYLIEYNIYTSSGEDGTVFIEFNLIDKQTGAKSNVDFTRIYGFKEEKQSLKKESKIQANLDVQKINIDMLNKNETKLSDFVKKNGLSDNDSSLFLISDYDKNKYNLKNFSYSVRTPYSISVHFSLENKTTLEVSAFRFVDIVGFKEVPLSEEEKAIKTLADTEVDKVKFDLKNKSEIDPFYGRFIPEISGFDATKYTIMSNSRVISILNNVVSVDYKIYLVFKYPNGRYVISKQKTIKISGFLNPEEIMKKQQQVDLELEKVKINIANKSEIPSNWFKYSPYFLISGFDKSKYEVKINDASSFVSNNQRVFVVVSLEELPNAYNSLYREKIKTKNRLIIISDFKTPSNNETEKRRWIQTLADSFVDKVDLVAKNKDKIYLPSVTSVNLLNAKKDIRESETILRGLYNTLDLDIEYKKNEENSIPIFHRDFSTVENPFGNIYRGQNQYEYRIENFEISKSDNKSAEITFYLYDNINNISSKRKTVTISGFGSPLTEEEHKSEQAKLDLEASKITFGIESVRDRKSGSKSNLFEALRISHSGPSRFLLLDSEGKNLSESKSFFINDSNFAVLYEDKKVFIEFSLVDKKTGLKSKLIKKELTSLVPISSAEKWTSIANSKIESIEIDYQNNSQLLASSIKDFSKLRASFSSTGNLEDLEFILRYNNFKVLKDNGGIEIDVYFFNPILNIISKKRTITLMGFLSLKDWETSRIEANQEVKKTVLDYRDKKTTNASSVDTTDSGFILKNYDKSKFNLSIKSVKVLDDKTSIEVVYNLINNNNKFRSHESDLPNSINKTVIISGFKPVTNSN